MKKVFVTLLVTYLMYPFFLSGIKPLQMLALYGGSLFYIGLNIRHLIRINRRVGIALVFITFICVFCACLSFVVPTIHQTYDFSYLTIAMLRFFLSCLLKFCAFLVIYNVENKRITLETYLLYFVRAVSIQVCFSIACLLLPDLKSYWVGVLSIDIIGMEMIETPYYITRFGLQGFAGFIDTYLCSISAISIFFMIARRVQKKEKSMSLVKYLVLSIIGTLFYGRVGLFSVIISLLVFLLYMIVAQKKIGVFIKTFVILMLVIIIFSSISNTDESFMAWYNWAVKPIVNLSTTGEVKDESFETLLRMYESKLSAEAILFGEGRYSAKNGWYYMNVDAGLLRQLFFWGIFPSLSIYISLILLFYKIVSLYKKQSGFLFVLLMSINFFMFEFKGEIVYHCIAFCWTLLWVVNSERQINKGIVT